MTMGEFRTPDRVEVSDEFDQVAAKLDNQGLYLDFDVFMNTTEKLGFSSQEASKALTDCSGDFSQAFDSLTGGADTSISETDPSVNAWAQAVGTTALGEMLKTAW